jgi:hypothetical protein
VLAQAVAAQRRLQESGQERARALGQRVRGLDGRAEGGIFVVGLGRALDAQEGGVQRGSPGASGRNAPRKSSMRPMRAITVREWGRLMWT